MLRTKRPRVSVVSRLGSLLLSVLLMMIASVPPEIAQAAAPPDSAFQKVVLDSSVNQPMELAVAFDGRVFFLDRTGQVEVYKPNTQTTVTAATIAVGVTGNHGLLGIALDPNFASNNWLYLLYSPPTPAVTRLSRFTMSGDTLNLSSEKILLSFATDRVCCHEGGSLAFGPDGNLYISTGDNTTPFQSSGYTPIDEGSGRVAYDAQKSSGNTNDLRGKILRIRPTSAGGYTIPSGNLFSSSATQRPEIYAMGFRNPFRISVDQATNWVYVGDVGPDASSDNANRGPRGYDEINQVRSAGNYGWPYCIANNKAYNDYDFATSTSGSKFVCSALNTVNNSPNNSGNASLPPARSSLIWYPYGASTEFPELGSTNKRTSMAGPVYHYAADNPSSRKLPAYFDERLFIYDYSRHWIKTVKLDANGGVDSIEAFLPSFTFKSPIDVEIGPDGALYVLEWGSGQGHESGADAKLSRIEYGSGSPVAVATANKTAGSLPLTVNFSGANSYDPDGGSLTYAWDLNGNGSTNSSLMNPSFTYTTPGNYTVQLVVTDPDNKTGISNITIYAGNNYPETTLTEPPNGGFFSWGEDIQFQASATDQEDGNAPCSGIRIEPGLGHDDHSHTDPGFYGCSGAIRIPVPSEDHSADLNVFYIVEAAYQDQGATNVASLRDADTSILQPKLKQAEFFTSMSGVQVQPTGDTLGGGQNVGYINNGDWIAFYPMNLRSINSVTYRVASAGLGGTIEVRAGSPTGTLLSTATIAVTGDWQNYTDVTAPITDPGGTHTLYFVFKGNAGQPGLFNLNWIEFNGPGVSTPPGSAVTYQAEQASLSGATIATNQVGYTGSGFVDYADDTPSGTYIEWNVNVATAGSYRLDFRYANGSAANRPLQLKVGSTVTHSNLSFNPTGTWSTWNTRSAVVNLAAGNNTIRLTATGSTGPNIDKLTLPVYEAERTTLNGAIVEALHAGYTGSGYANFDSSAGNYVEWRVNVPTAGTYALEFRYANGSAANRPLEIKVGSTVVAASKAFNPTGNWTSWNTTSVNASLSAGENIIRITTTGIDGPNIDHLTIR